MKPNKLKKGDTIVVIAPLSVFVICFTRRGFIKTPSFAIVQTAVII